MFDNTKVQFKSLESSCLEASVDAQSCFCSCCFNLFEELDVLVDCWIFIWF